MIIVENDEHIRKVLGCDELLGLADAGELAGSARK
jgi:hypothetical protein